MNEKGSRLIMIKKLIALIIVSIGVIFIFDARIIINKWFGIGDQNEGITGLKILGFVFVYIGGVILYFI